MQLYLDKVVLKCGPQANMRLMAFPPTSLSKNRKWKEFNPARMTPTDTQNTIIAKLSIGGCVIFATDKSITHKSLLFKVKCFKRINCCELQRIDIYVSQTFKVTF